MYRGHHWGPLVWKAIAEEERTLSCPHSWLLTLVYFFTTLAFVHFHTVFHRFRSALLFNTHSSPFQSITGIINHKSFICHKRKKNTVFIAISLSSSQSAIYTQRHPSPHHSRLKPLPQKSTTCTQMSITKPYTHPHTHTKKSFMTNPKLMTRTLS